MVEDRGRGETETRQLGIIWPFSACLSVSELNPSVGSVPVMCVQCSELQGSLQDEIVTITEIE